MVVVRQPIATSRQRIPIVLDKNADLHWSAFSLETLVVRGEIEPTNARICKAKGIWPINMAIRQVLDHRPIP